MPRKNYIISVKGCDDSTVFPMLLTEKEAALVKKVADKCTETSTYGCMPTITIGEEA